MYIHFVHLGAEIHVRLITEQRNATDAHLPNLASSYIDLAAYIMPGHKIHYTTHRLSSVVVTCLVHVPAGVVYMYMYK